MARHIMAVCVVCLLCAEHVPCQQHIPPMGGHNFSTMSQLNATLTAPATPNRAPTSATVKSVMPYTTSTASRTYTDHKMRRRKRHASHHHHSGNTVTESNNNVRPEITEIFLDRLFSDYGREDGTIHMHDFYRLLKEIGLEQLLVKKLNKEQEQQQQQQQNNNETCIEDKELVHYLKSNNHNNYKPINVGSGLCANMSDQQSCSSLYPKQYPNYTLNTYDVINVCPVLLYQMAIQQQRQQQNSSQQHDCIKKELLTGIDVDDAGHMEMHKDDIIYVWIYAFISVFACSILGLVGVAIIPFMDSRFYKHIVQFLVSLAVGTMTGDALLHLLPHSVAGQDEKNMILKGLVCMGGILFFYITEHGLTMISEWRKRLAKTEANRPSRAKVVRDPDSSHNTSMTGDKMCKSKYSSYPYCYDEIAMDTRNDVWLHMPNNSNDCNTPSTRNGKLDGDTLAETAAQSLLSPSQNSYAPIPQTSTNRSLSYHNNQRQHQHQQQQLLHSNSVAPDLDGNVIVNDGINTVAKSNGKDASVINETVTVILREHDSTHHGHSHKHGHVHSPPESVSAVVWMIIMGDGLHNFTDGMAIGAAFAENMAGGFSTSLAVFCHELPHELGDFAILMKAGMSVKSAVCYNLLTGILSFIGMIFGIVFGQAPETAQWMFAAAAGLFIYIAMVDMMPEISAAHKSLEQFVLQILGMGSGVLLMLLIAIYEDDLMNIFSYSSDTSSSHHVH